MHASSNFFWMLGCQPNDFVRSLNTALNSSGPRVSHMPVMIM